MLTSSGGYGIRRFLRPLKRCGIAQIVKNKASKRVPFVQTKFEDRTTKTPSPSRFDKQTPTSGGRWLARSVLLAQAVGMAGCSSAGKSSRASPNVAYQPPTRAYSGFVFLNSCRHCQKAPTFIRLLRTGTS